MLCAIPCVSQSLDTCKGVCYTVKMDSAAIHCMLNQAAKDTIIKSRGRQIESMKKERALDSAFLAMQKIELTQYKGKLIKCRKSHKLTFAGGIGVGSVVMYFISKLL